MIARVFSIHIFSNLNKKRKKEGVFVAIYGRFRTIAIRMTPIIMITMIIAIADPKMYVSVFEAGGAAVGVGVAAASITLNTVLAVDGQYPFVPEKVAITL
jgi:hypothetical protein